MNLRPFTDCMVDGVHCSPDGMRARPRRQYLVQLGRAAGLCRRNGVEPGRQMIGRIRLPEGCANLCFAGPKRDHLFMAATQSIYMLRVNIQGASPG